MNWDAIGAVSELAGAVGVIITLLYLAIQIRHASNTAEDAATRDVFSAVGTQLTTMVEEANSEILLKGLTDYKNLAGRDKFVFDGLIGGLMVLVESSFISNEAALLTDESMENWGCYLRPRLLSYVGMRDWWEESRDTFVPQAQAWVDSQIEKSDVDSDFWKIKSAT